MSAPHPRELLELYLQGELSDEECDALESWLREDPAHERELKAAERTLAAFDAALAPPEGSDELVERTLGEARQRFDAEHAEQEPVSFPVRGWALCTVAAAAVLTSLLIVLGPPDESGEVHTLAELRGWTVLPSAGTEWSMLAEDRLRLEHGELALSSVGLDAPALVVETPHARLEASGTRFVVGTLDTAPKGSAMTSLTRLLVLSGVVSLSNTLGSIEAAAGEWAVADDQRPPIKFAAEAQTEMGFDLYRNLVTKKPDENVCLSPISIAQAFALLAEGADEPVMEALAELLQLPADARAVGGEGQRFAASLMRLRTGLLELKHYFATRGEQRLDIANALWIDDSVSLAPAFQHAVAGEWAAELHSADFQHQAGDERRRINDWVKEVTQGHIPELLASGSLDELTRVVISNALYFQAKWEEPFPARQGQMDFTRPDGSKVKAPRMYQDDSKHDLVDGDWYSSELKFPYGSFDAQGQLRGQFESPTFDGVQILSYPYEGGRLSMDFLLPGTHDGLPALEAQLDDEWLRTRLSKLHTQSVKITLPRFEVSSRTDLRSLLDDMGLGALFTPGGLKNLAEGPDAAGLYVSDAVHETWLRINETGTEAAAATAVRIRALSSTAVFRADRPFVYVVRDGETGAVLFVGRVVDPSEG